MKLTIQEDREKHRLAGVQHIFVIGKNYTQCPELQNTILVVHAANHVEKYRLYKDARILSVEEEY